MVINRCKLAIVSLFLMAIGFWFLPLHASARGIKVKIKASENVSAPVVGEVNLYGESYALVIGIDTGILY